MMHLSSARLAISASQAQPLQTTFPSSALPASTAKKELSCPQSALKAHSRRREPSLKMIAQIARLDSIAFRDRQNKFLVLLVITALMEHKSQFLAQLEHTTQ